MEANLGCSCGGKQVWDSTINALVCLDCGKRARPKSKAELLLTLDEAKAYIIQLENKGGGLLAENTELKKEIAKLKQKHSDFLHHIIQPNDD